jgi:non-homologous end joining protein Ku
MLRAGRNGFLRLSLVTCPVYLRPDTAEVNRIPNEPCGTRR